MGAAGVFAALLLSCVIAGLNWRSLRRLGRRHAALADELLVAHREFDAATTVINRIGRRLQAAEAQASALRDRLETIERRAEPRAFAQAIDFARRGVPPSQLSSQCGLSPGEAELVAQLHGGRKTA
jgi:type II secretory pathway component PulJ